MNSNSVASDAKSIAWPETTDSTRPARYPCSTTVSDWHWTTKAQRTDKGAGLSIGGTRAYFSGGRDGDVGDPGFETEA